MSAEKSGAGCSTAIDGIHETPVVLDSGNANDGQTQNHQECRHGNLTRSYTHRGKRNRSRSRGRRSRSQSATDVMQGTTLIVVDSGNANDGQKHHECRRGNLTRSCTHRGKRDRSRSRGRRSRSHSRGRRSRSHSRGRRSRSHSRGRRSRSHSRGNKSRSRSRSESSSSSSNASFNECHHHGPLHQNRRHKHKHLRHHGGRHEMRRHCRKNWHPSTKSFGHVKDQSQQFCKILSTRVEKAKLNHGCCCCAKNAVENVAAEANVVG